MNGNGNVSPAAVIRMPGCVIGWVVTDLVFCFIRSLLVILGIIGLFFADKTSPLYPTISSELFSGMMIVVFGIWGNISILLQKPFGVALARLNVFATLFSFLVAVRQAFIMAKMTDGAELAVLLSVAGWTLAVRCVLLWFYRRAIGKAEQFFDARSQSDDGDAVAP